MTDNRETFSNVVLVLHFASFFYRYFTVAVIPISTLHVTKELITTCIAWLSVLYTCVQKITETWKFGYIKCVIGIKGDEMGTKWEWEYKKYEMFEIVSRNSKRPPTIATTRVLVRFRKTPFPYVCT